MPDRSDPNEPTEAQQTTGTRATGDDRSGREWADDVANARTSDDPRARAPHDAGGTPSTRPFDE